MPFCPVCRTEYRAGVQVCADDGATLVDSLPGDDMTGTALVEIYTTYNGLEGERIFGILEDKGIACFVRSLQRAAFPTSAGAEAATRIAVPRVDVDKATALITQAREDEVVSRDGAFIS